MPVAKGICTKGSHRTNQAQVQRQVHQCVAHPFKGKAGCQAQQIQASAANPCLESRHQRCRFHKTKGYPAGANTQAGTKCKRCKQPYAQHPFSNLQTPLAAVIARVRTSQQKLKGSFTTPVDLRSGFAAPVNLRMQFVRLVTIGRQLCLRSASGSSFATPFGRKLQFYPSHRKSRKSPKTPIFRGTKNRIFEARKNRLFPGFRKIRISELSPGMLNRIFRCFPLRDFP